MSENEKNDFIKQFSKELDVKIPQNRIPSLSWHNVREMYQNNIYFGSHTVTHPILTKISLKKAKYEITRSKEQIEKHIGGKVTVLAYPNGRQQDMSESLDSLLKQNGFIFSLSTIYGTNIPNSNLFRLNRIGIEYNDNLNLFRIKLLGLGKLFAPIYKKLVFKT